MSVGRFALRRRARQRPWCLLLGLLTLALLATGCTRNPATGEPSFTAFMSPTEEVSVGAEENPKVLAAFGGEYPDPRLAAYVRRVGAALAAHAERKDVQYRFTVLNSPTVNAFSLPGGYVYVTRGLLALADSEAELAAVLGHELGHINARHAAQRYSKEKVGNVGAAAIGLLTNSKDVAEAAQEGEQSFLTAHSREEEYQADELGIRYLRHAGYDTMAMARMLAALEGDERLQSILAGTTLAPRGFLATHPATAERLERAQALAGSEAAVSAGPLLGEAEYLAAIDGLFYGDDPADGILRGRILMQQRRHYRFEVPQGFAVFHGESRLTLRQPGGAVVVFDMAKLPFDGGLGDYIRASWAPDLTLDKIEAMTVGGLAGAAATGHATLKEGGRDLALAALRKSPSEIYRFIMLT
ncbi:MAG: M48 family metalloprotease, partial [Alphaproteobacteria bacterium]